MSLCFRLYTRLCCDPRPAFLDRFSPFLLMLPTMTLVVGVMFLMPVQLAARMQVALFMGWFFYLLMGFFDCGDYWSHNVAARSANRRWVYVALSSPFFFMFLTMTILRALS